MAEDIAVGLEANPPCTPEGNLCLVVDLTGMSGQAPTLCPPSAGMRDPVAVNEEALCPPNRIVVKVHR